ncbi:MAG: HAD-IG family 5'-nucleotidase [Luteitalea sp.]|nr:HAD-IG family 5'-nucleotidase [Luteitalea sp.]
MTLKAPNDRSQSYAHDSAPAMLHLLERASAGADPAFERRVFSNRTLRMETIEVICFDLDWTLAAYDRELLHRLIFDTALERLVDRYGYPAEIRSAEFRSDFAHRGLLIDKAAGTVVKMDRHFFVGRAYLGRRLLTSIERMDLYRRERVDMRRTRFYHVDTLFELAEVNLFSELVELVQRGVIACGARVFEGIFEDVRHAVDGVHADGTLKSRIIEDLPRLLPDDADLPLTIKKLALTGRRLLLISNSEWYYTDAVCQYLFARAAPDREWQKLFDLIVVSARKPLFFRDQSPFSAIDDDGNPAGTVEAPVWGGRYIGGSRDKLTPLLGVPGERVLYVGDHIYSDILATKMRSTWRTMLIVSELEEELRIRRRLLDDLGRYTDLNNVMSDLGRRLENARDVVRLRALLGSEASSDERTELADLDRAVQELADGHEVVRRRASMIDDRIITEFNPYWGSVFKQGSSQSLFGSQVDAFACLYTSRVSNLLAYGNSHYFRVMSDPMIHEIQQS